MAITEREFLAPSTDPGQLKLGEESQAEPSMSSILWINDDIFLLIAEQLFENRNVSLFNLSLCCRSLRQRLLPILFSACHVCEPAKMGVPPLAIRPHVRRLRFDWYLYHWEYHPGVVVTMEKFGVAFHCLPALRSVVFDMIAKMGVPWEALKLCLSFPNIKAITFTEKAPFTAIDPFPPESLSTTSELEELSYPAILSPKINPQQPTTDAASLERTCLLPLVLGMSRTARLLRLPMSTAPLSAMADVHWPSLETLSLSGSFSRDKAGQVTNCPSYLFTHTPNLRDLTITAALHQTSNARASVLGRDASPRNVLRRLHSLKLAYPDPEDAIFSIDAAPLVHLSLRDWPRHYEIPGPPSNRNQWRSPILIASEALSILRRIRTADIGTLEIVYAADAVDPELLAFIARALPSLKHLELHRYRQDTEIDVDYRSISRTLSTVGTLVSLRLNLDFGGDPGPHSIESIYIAAERWYPRLANIGWDILGIVKACPLLEHVMLLYHGHPPSLSRWLCFSRSNHATREIVSGSSDCVLRPPSRK